MVKIYLISVKVNGTYEDKEMGVQINDEEKILL